jgi:phosphohistidine phosphatase
MASNGRVPIQQAAAVPYRMRDDRPEFCLVTSIDRGNWIFPKGIIDPGETPQQTALKEAVEEAGLHGVIEGKPLGQYDYRKWNTRLVVTAMLMRVTAADDEWEESGVRQRCWCGVEKARAKINRGELRDLLEAAVKRLA